MSGIPTKADYTRADLDAARALCLYVATRLGDLLAAVVVVGGLVPSLLVGDPDEATGVERHIGTKDVDLGLALRLLDGRRYAELSQRLRSAGFRRDVNEHGNPANARWTLGEVPGVKLDFLIPPVNERHVGGELHRLEGDFAAYVIPGLELAFVDRREVEISGVTSMGERATRSIYVCEAGAYAVLKALAIRGRGAEKDAYDLDWLLQAYPGGVEAVAERLRALPDGRARRDAIETLASEFASMDSVGPVRAARFLRRDAEDAVRADAHGRVQHLLRLVRAP